MQAESIRRNARMLFYNGNYMGHISDYIYNKDRIITAKGKMI